MRLVNALDREEITLENVEVILDWETVESRDLAIDPEIVYYLDEDGRITEDYSEASKMEASENGVMDDAIQDYEASGFIEIDGSVLTAEIIDLYYAYEDCDSDLLQRVYNRYI